MNVTINLALDEVLIPEGLYLVEVTDVLVRSGQNGIYLLWVLTILEGPHEGKTVTMVGSLRDDLLHLLRAQFAAVGVDVSGEVIFEWDEKILKKNYSAPLDSPEVIGAQATAVVVHDEWEGEPQSKARRFLARVPIEEVEATA